MTFKDLFDEFTLKFVDDDDNEDNEDGDDDEITPQTIHDLAAALGASCKHCASRKPQRRKALDRVDTRAAVMARAAARQRRLALLQSVAIAETER